MQQTYNTPKPAQEFKTYKANLNNKLRNARKVNLISETEAAQIKESILQAEYNADLIDANNQLNTFIKS